MGPNKETGQQTEKTKHTKKQKTKKRQKHLADDFTVSATNRKCCHARRVTGRKHGLGHGRLSPDRTECRQWRAKALTAHVQLHEGIQRRALKAQPAQLAARVDRVARRFDRVTP